MRKVVLEARINEYATRSANPHVPWTVEEIARDAHSCVAAGASIIHFHARFPDGTPSHDYESYRAVAAAVRETADVMIHPTLGVEKQDRDPARRLDHIERLVKDGLSPDFAPLDMGSSNIDFLDRETGRFLSQDAVYVNTTATLRYFAEHLRDIGVSPYLQLWNIPHIRQMSAFIDHGYLTPPLFAAFALSDGGAIATHPGTMAGLRAYLSCLPEHIPLTWSTARFGGSLLGLIPSIVELGGHVSLGLGDYPYPELDFPSNGRLIAEAARLIRSAGADIATVDEARSLLGRA